MKAYTQFEIRGHKPDVNHKMTMTLDDDLGAQEEAKGHEPDRLLDE